jgi:hypothetical protein
VSLSPTHLLPWPMPLHTATATAEKATTHATSPATQARLKPETFFADGSRIRLIEPMTPEREATLAWCKVAGLDGAWWDLGRCGGPGRRRPQSCSSTRPVGRAASPQERLGACGVRVTRPGYLLPLTASCLLPLRLVWRRRCATTEGPALRAAREPTRRGDRVCVPLGTRQWGRVSERWLLCAGEYQAQGICSRRRLRRALRFKPPSSGSKVPACKC